MVQLDDDTLIALIKKGDTHAEALLCSKYWVFAKKLGYNFALLYRDLGFTIDEFTTVCFSALVTAIKKYRPHQDKAFKSYWSAVAKNQCINYVHENSTIDVDMKRPISFDATGYDDGLSLHDTFGSDDHSISYQLMRRRLLELVFEEDEDLLSNDEKIVVYYMFLNDYSYSELKMLTKWTKSKMYHVVGNARTKVSNFFKSGYFK